jgi:leucyl aminopeptidase
MKISVRKGEIDKFTAEALVVSCFEGMTNELVKKLDKAVGNLVERLVKEGEFSGKFSQIAVLHTEGKIPARRVLLIGLGKKEEFYFDRIRQVHAKAAIHAREIGVKSFASCLHCYESDGSPREVARAVVEGILLGLYKFDKYKTEKEKKNEIEEFTVICENEVDEVEEGVKLGKTLAEATNFTRELVNLPGNEATPAKLAEVAKGLAREYKLRIKVFEREDMKRLGMYGLLAVSQGSVQPPKFIVLEYNSGKKPTIALVGKGITFDSGGISLKPGKDMDKMKHDKAGACAVLGIIKAAAELKLPMNIVGFIPATENLPSGSAYKPGDIIKTYSKKTVEVVNTDAEGRIILADALAYASTYKPTALIDLATLTGACVIALGDLAIGLMGNDQNLIERIEDAGEKAWERTWQLPLWKEYDEYDKSDVADVKNIGGKSGEAGTITAAAFLKTFVGETPWAHLDIAGTAWVEREKPYNLKGATGVGVRLIIQLLMGWS